MNITKRDITKKITNDTGIVNSEALDFLNSFIKIIVQNSYEFNKVTKISAFGSFYMKKTKERIGRNPLTKESYKISKREKLSFTASSKVKNLLN
tara:strand:- start:301 stop:582 length:282 start_codon:yes stop_codon:yes gene_type:complete